MKTAIIIGATSGIGLEVAKRLVAEGWRIGAAGRREERLADLQKECGEESVAYESMDITKPSALEALDRLLEKTGVPVMAIHRGCGHQPCWAMAHKVRIARPDIPMLLDPSHMSGDADKVPELMSRIAELGLDGAMIEVHCNPEHALSDKRQQLRPVDLRELVEKQLTNNQRITNESLTVESNESAELHWLRAEIDELDERLWDTIAARMDVSARIGEWKKAHGVAPLQPERVKIIGERLKAKGERLGLDEAWMLRVWDLIHEESLKQQK